MSAVGVTAALPLSVRAGSRLAAGRHVAVYIDTRHKTFSGGSRREIVNRGDQPLVLNGYQPVSIRNSQGDYTTLHLNTPDTLYTLQPGERLPVYAQAVMTTLPQASNQAASLWSDSVAIV